MWVEYRGSYAPERSHRWLRYKRRDITTAVDVQWPWSVPDDSVHLFESTHFISPTHFRALSPSAGHHRPSSPFNNHSQRGKHVLKKRSRKDRLWSIFLKGKGGRRETKSASLETASLEDYKRPGSWRSWESVCLGSLTGRAHHSPQLLWALFTKQEHK